MPLHSTPFPAPPQRRAEQVQRSNWECSALTSELTHELSVHISAFQTESPSQHAAAQGVRCLGLGSPPITYFSPSVTVCSHLPPVCLQRAPYPGSVSRDPKELLIAACLLNLGYFDRSVAEDARNKQAGAVTPSQLLPTPGLTLPKSPCLQSCFATTLRYSNSATHPVTRGLISCRQTWISYMGKKSSSPRLSHLQSQRGHRLGGKPGWLSPVAVPSMAEGNGDEGRCCSYLRTHRS